MRKSIVALLLVLVLVVGMIPAYGVAGNTQSRADVLNQLKLISGTGAGYNLEGELTRAEAATFIVKFVGEENDVIKNASQYKLTGFSDVESTAWYAPFVGYVKQEGIVTGFPDGTFKPNDKISEKAFLSMILKSLGYSSSDYTWDTVQQKAYDVGLVTDISYAVKNEDNPNYLRGSVVDVMYNGITKTIKGSNKTPVDDLVTKGIVTQAVAESLGVVAIDEVKTAIEPVKALSPTSIKIKLNEENVSITKNDVSIKEKKSDTLLIIENVTITDDVVTISTASQKEDVEYTVTVDLVTDSSGFTVVGLSDTFSGYTIPEIVSNYFKISKVQAVNKHQVNVYFTHPIDIDAELPVYYSLFKGENEVVDGSFKTIIAKQMGGVDNAVTLRFKDYTLDAGDTYTLKVKGDVESKYSANLNEGDGESFNFTGVGSDPEQLKVVDIDAINSKMIRIVFNNDIDKDTAEKLTNYKLVDNTSGITYNQAFNVYFTGTGAKENKQIDIKVLTMDKKHEYELTIDGVKDAMEFTVIDDAEFLFYGYDELQADLEIQHVSAVHEGLIQIYFDQSLSTDAAGASVIVDGSTVNTKYFNPNKPFILYVYLSDSNKLKNQDYKVRILGGLKTANNVEQVGTLEYTFSGTTEDVHPISIKDAVFIAEDMVKIDFNQPISKSLNNSTSKFKLDYEESDGDDKTINSSSVTFVDEFTAIVKFNMPDSGQDYQIRCTSLFDFSGQRQTSSTESSIK